MSSTQISLIVSVVLNVVLLALAFIWYSDSSKVGADLAKVTSDLNDRNTTIKGLNDNINDVKQSIGITNINEIGNQDQIDQKDTLLGAINAMVEDKAEVTEGAKDLQVAVNKLRQELDNEKLSNVTKQGELAAKIAEYGAMVQQKDGTIRQHLTAKDKAEKDLRDREKEHSEEVARKDQLIDGLTIEKNDLQDELSRVRAELTAQIDDLQERVTTQTGTIVRLRREKFEREDLSFERADGVVQYVDHARRLVWINLGRADGLRVGTTFSVYSKDNSGIGRRNTEDIKASIEVTNVLGPHRAEARILDANNGVKSRPEDDIDAYFGRNSRYYQSHLLRPIAVGDPVYSPAFNRGNVEKFSFVGFVDLDGDGKSDREMLRNVVRAAGGYIDNEIDDEGNEVVREGITYQTRFLVIGDLGDPSKTDDTDLKAAISRIQEKNSELQDEALDNGTRIVTLRAFLDYMGVEVGATPWVSGDDYKTRLKAGAASRGTSEALGNRTSSGQVSGLHDVYKRRLYNLNDKLGKRHSNGAVSRLYDDR